MIQLDWKKTDRELRKLERAQKVVIKEKVRDTIGEQRFEYRASLANGLALLYNVTFTDYKNDA